MRVCKWEDGFGNQEILKKAEKWIRMPRPLYSEATSTQERQPRHSPPGARRLIVGINKFLKSLSHHDGCLARCAMRISAGVPNWLAFQLVLVGPYNKCGISRWGMGISRRTTQLSLAFPGRTPNPITYHQHLTFAVLLDAISPYCVLLRRCTRVGNPCPMSSQLLVVNRYALE